MDVEVEFPEVYKGLDDPCRYKVMYGGRAAARSRTISGKLLIRALQSKIRVLCTRELQKSIKQSVHKLLSMQIDRYGLTKYFNITDATITSAIGSEFIFMGVRHNAEEIKSTEAIDICWIEEGHSLTEASWDIIDPTIRQEKSEIWVSFNTRFKFDHVYQTFVVKTPPPSSWVVKTSHHDNPFFPDVLKQQMLVMQERDYEKYLHIWEGNLKKLAEGAIFGDQITAIHKEGRLCRVPVEPNCEVRTYWDMGKGDHTAIWFIQEVGKAYHVIDYYQNRLKDIDHYVRYVKSLGYNYAEHYMPHDADHDRLGMVLNIREQFEESGIEPVEIVERIRHKETAIELARARITMCWFHHGDDERGKRMEVGYDSLCNYRYKYKDDDDVYQNKPHHDHASNGADAFQQFAQSESAFNYDEDYDEAGHYQETNAMGY